MIQTGIHSQCPTAERIWVEVDRNLWKQNYKAISKTVSPVLVAPVLKANGYGLGAREAAAAFCRAGASMIVVSCLKEALEISGICPEILLLGAPVPDEIPAIIENNFAATVPDFETASHFSRCAGLLGTNASVHIKIDTGMGRLGIPVDTAEQEIKQIFSLPHLTIEGIYSHFAAAGLQDKETERQHSSMKTLLAQLQHGGITFSKIHIANSTATAGIREATKLPFTMVRCGLDLHGAHLSITPRPYIVEPVMTLKARLASVRTLPAGASVSYGRTYRIEKPEGERIGVVAIGYADGYPRCLSNKGEMLVRGKRCRVIGRVCMDYTMISLENVPHAKTGDEVVIIGKQKEDCISLAEVARTAETIPYEIICSLGPRVTRHYIN